LRYTPRQVVAFSLLVAKRKAREDARGLSLNAMAARGDSKELQKQIDNLEKAADSDR
jgi:hypothetical protein